MEKRSGGLYEPFLALPVAMVLTVLWVAGAVLAGACIVALYGGGLVLVRFLGALL